jgi:PhzF family phenazine biosynthesis protein
MLSLEPDALGAQPLWVDTGAEQLLVPLTDVDAVRRARPDAAALATIGFSRRRGASMAYVWARAADGTIEARFFFSSVGVAEDPATGSACANLGGWMIATGAPLPLALEVRQGREVGRPSRLWLEVGADRSIRVGGTVIEVARGLVTL